MSTSSNPQAGPLDELVEQLLQCGGVLSQMISGMVRFAASGRSAPDAAPIPDVAHDLIRSVIEHLPKRYSDAEITTAAAMVGEVTDAICNDIYIVSDKLFDEVEEEAAHDRFHEHDNTHEDLAWRPDLDPGADPPPLGDVNGRAPRRGRPSGA